MNAARTVARRSPPGWTPAFLVTILLGAPLSVPACQSGVPEATPEDAICAEHGVAEARCPFCNPSLIEEMGVCGAHGVPEALCTRCDAALIPAFQAVGDWCASHSVPESQCTTCNPGILDQPRGEGPAGGGVPETRLASIEKVPEDELPRWRRGPSVRCEKERLRVRLASPEIARTVGFEFARIEERPLRRTVECNAEVGYDENRMARIGARAHGVIREVAVDLGAPIEAGQTLAVIDSIEVGEAKAEHLQAIALGSLWKRTYETERALLEKGISTRREVLEAETRREESRIAIDRAVQRLRNLGLSDEEIAEAAEERDTSSLLPLASPRDGVLIERSAIAGQVVNPTDVLFVVADPGRMWVDLDVYEDDLAAVRLGQGIVHRPDGLQGEAFGGRITWIGTAVDRRTRTVPVRAEVENPDGLLRARTFGRAEIRIGTTGMAILVPREAVQWEGCCNIVFLRRSDTLFEPRKLRLGCATGRAFEVLEGLSAGDVVVTQGAFLLKTEILRESIGAGCCDPGPPER